MERYNPVEDRWTPCAPLRACRENLGCAAFRGRIYAVGGRGDFTELCSAERFDPLTNEWSAVPSMKSKRSKVSAAGRATGTPQELRASACPGQVVVGFLRPTFHPSSIWGRSTGPRFHAVWAACPAFRERPGFKSRRHGGNSERRPLGHLRELRTSLLKWPEVARS